MIKERGVKRRKKGEGRRERGEGAALLRCIALLPSPFSLLPFK
jgi:hypothetical protein